MDQLLATPLLLLAFLDKSFQQAVALYRKYTNKIQTNIAVRNDFSLQISINNNLSIQNKMYQFLLQFRLGRKKAQESFLYFKIKNEQPTVKQVTSRCHSNESCCMSCCVYVCGGTSKVNLTSFFALIIYLCSPVRIFCSLSNIGSEWVALVSIICFIGIIIGNLSDLLYSMTKVTWLNIIIFLTYFCRYSFILSYRYFFPRLKSLGSRIFQAMDLLYLLEII